MRCSSEPSPSAAPRFTRRPQQVAFYFSEPVEASFGAVRDLRHRGRAGRKRRDHPARGAKRRRRGRRSIRELPRWHLHGDLPGHLRRFASGLGRVRLHALASRGGPGRDGLRAARGQPTPAPVTSVAYWAARWLGYAAIGLGGRVCSASCAPIWWPALRRVGGRCRRVGRGAGSASPGGPCAACSIAAAIGLLSSAAPLVLQGATAAGHLVLGGARSRQSSSEVLETRFGALDRRCESWPGPSSPRSSS